nr:uncharacterized protein LOC109183092 [Ipomoea batatas]
MFVVAQGTAYPTTAETTIVHNQPVLPNHVKVMVDEVVIGAEDCLIPVPVLQYTTLNDVVGTYTQWPIHLVLLDEANVKIRSPRQNKPIKDPSVDLSAAGTRRLGPIVGENVFMLLGKNCKRLVKTLTSFPGAFASMLRCLFGKHVSRRANIKASAVWLNFLRVTTSTDNGCEAHGTVCCTIRLES